MNDWDIIDLHFKDHKYPFTNHHLDSFREFIKTYIPKTIKSYNPITMIKYEDIKEEKIKLKVDVNVGGEKANKIYIDHPIMYENGNQKIITPNDARLKSISYESHLYADVDVEITNEVGEVYRQTFEKVALGSVPIMLHSDICVLNGNGNRVLQRLGECVYDAGGYFIIDGKEKVIIAQETETNNRLIVKKLKEDDNFSYTGKIKCSGEEGETALVPRNIEFFLVKNDETEVTEKYKNFKGAIYISLPSIEGKIPLFTFFRALGIESDKEIYELIFGVDNTEVETVYFSNFIRPTIYNNYYINETTKEKYFIYTQAEALNYLKFRTKYQTLEHLKYLLSVDILPNIKLFENKSKYFGYLTKEFIDIALNIKKESDRDNYFNKRIYISGYLLSELFQNAYARLRKMIRDNLDKTYYFGTWRNTNNYANFINKDNIFYIIDVLIIAQTFGRSLKGRWGLDIEDDPDLDKVQDLSRISYISFLSHLRRVNMPIDRTIKVTAPHKLHLHQWGYMCPFETPDGEAIGYLKNLAFLTKVTAGTTPEVIRKCLYDIGIIPIENYNLKINRNVCKVFLNNSWYGITNNPILMIRILKAYRRNALINILTTINWDTLSNELRIYSDVGRAVRPLIILEKGNSRIFTDKYNNWFDLIIGKYNNYKEKERSEEIYYKDEYINPRKLDVFKGKSNEFILEELEKEGAVIEYIDPQETDSSFIAMYKKDINNFHTHLEIHPSTIVSVVSGNIPMVNHNAASRNIFHAAQTKQAIGIYATNFNKRFDTFGYIQHYPQKAILNTRHSQYTGSDMMANGANLIVAIMTYSGYNQEDSLIINRKSIERGLFHLSYYKSISVSSKKESDDIRIIFANPIKLRDEGKKINGIKHADYSLINEEGFIKEGSYIPKGKQAVIIGMIMERNVIRTVKKGIYTDIIKETIYNDVSIVSDETYYGYIDKVFIGTKTLDDDTKVCKVRFLKIKVPEFGDKHSSRHGQKGVIGMILSEEQMPFTKEGIKPDLIVNPHAIPSRMTIGHMVESVYSKLCCLEGVLGDATVFINLDYDKIYDNLEKLEYEKHGNEILYNGQTGRQINCDIYIGPTYYFRLKHMVADKINARGKGPLVQLTRQPTGGRRKAGGLRIGEMERDSLISHGISRFIQESMMERSDIYRWQVCKRCGTIPVYGNKMKNTYCSLCENNESSIIETPYTFKLLSQEFEAMGVQIRFNTDNAEIPLDDDLDLDSDVDIDIDMSKLNDEVEVKVEVDEILVKSSVKIFKNKMDIIEAIKVKFPSLKGYITYKKEELEYIYKCITIEDALIYIKNKKTKGGEEVNNQAEEEEIDNDINDDDDELNQVDSNIENGIKNANYESDGSNEEEELEEEELGEEEEWKEDEEEWEDDELGEEEEWEEDDDEEEEVKKEVNEEQKEEEKKEEDKGGGKEEIKVIEL